MPNSIGENLTKQKLKAGELVLFMGVNQMRTPNIAMIAASCGFDGVYIDLEHNPTSLEAAAAICVASLGLGITPIARVSSRGQHRHRGRDSRRKLPVSAARSPLGFWQRPGAGLCGSLARGDQHLSQRADPADRDAGNPRSDR
jgi:hypothetical protein